MNIMTPQGQVQSGFDRRQTLLEEARLDQLAREATRDREHFPARLARLIHELHWVELKLHRQPAPSEQQAAVDVTRHAHAR